MDYKIATFDARRDVPVSRTARAPVREMRSRLTGVTGEGLPFRHELLSLFVRNQLSIALAMPVIAVIVAASTVLWAPWASGAFWLSTTFISQGIMLTLCRVYERADPVEINVAEWNGKLAAAEFLHAVNWASLLFLFWDKGGTVAHVYITAMLIVVISIRMAIASNCLAVVYAGTVPLTAAITFKCAMQGEPLYSAMAIIAIAAQIYFLRLARSLNNTARDMLEFRAQKDTLIAELAQAKANSDEARRRAEDANVAKSRFLATMSHELRTPLNAILGFSEIMKEEILGPHTVPVYKEYAADIHKSGEHLLNLIGEILDLSRVEAGRYEMNEDAVTVQHIGEECKDMLDLRAQERGVHVVEDFEQDLPILYGDERAVRQIWLNLLSNAIKFTPRGGTITLSVARGRNGGLMMSVTDNGPGIPQEEIPVVLSAFGQGSLKRQKAEEGAGLGLPIVQGLAKLHGGTLTLTSEVGVGTRATVEFPPERILKETGQFALEPQGAAA